MHVARVRRVHGEREYVSVLLRQSYRVGRQVKHRTLASLTGLPEPVIDAIERSLRGERLVAAEGAVRILRSLPHGHVAAILGTAGRLELPALIDRRSTRERDLALALICQRVAEPASKLATAARLGQSTLAPMLGIEGVSEDELYRAMDWLLSRPGADRGRPGATPSRGGLATCCTTSPVRTSRAATARSRATATAATGGPTGPRSCSAS